MHFKRQIVFLMIFLFIGAASIAVFSQSCHGSGGKSSSEKFVVFPGEGKKVWLGNDHYMVYKFSKKPVIGTVVLKIEVFGRDGKKDTSFKITGDSGMPSMTGAHDSGDIEFKLNKKGDYLLPVNVVMPGDWEVRIKIKRDNKSICNGSVKFDV